MTKLQNLMSPSLGLPLLKWSVVGLLAAMVLGGAALIHLGDQSIFAAELEGGDAEPQAHAAAARLNQVFSSITAASARIEVRPPSSMRPLIWGGFGFFVLLVLVIYRELFKPGTRHDDSSRPAPLGGST